MDFTCFFSVSDTMEDPSVQAWEKWMVEKAKQMRIRQEEEKEQKLKEKQLEKAKRLEKVSFWFLVVACKLFCTQFVTIVQWICCTQSST